jgi:ribose transport system ATP-binding protein
MALDSVDFALRAGEVHGLVGENGAGKSTMMKLFAGVHGGDYDGEIRLEGRPVRFSSPGEAQARGIGMVYQELSGFPHLTVAENIFGRRLPVRRGLVDWKEMLRGAQDHLRQFGLDIDVTHTMGSLPVGHQQLVEISRVIWSGARIVILDEPTSALSPPETRRLFDFLTRLKAQGKTAVFISHFLDDVLAISDRVTVLKSGRVVASLDAANTDKQRLIALMIGAHAVDPARLLEAGGENRLPRSAPAGPEMVTVRSLTKRDAFADVSLAIRQGEIVGLFAFMGAGQNQLAQCLFGAARADHGEILLDGNPVRLTNTTRARKAGIGYVPENRRDGLMLGQPVYRNMTLAHLGQLLRGWVNERLERTIASAQIHDLGIRPPDPDLPVGALSGGNQQKVVLAKWLTRKPRVLILNEPTRGMDVGAKDEVTGIVRRLRDQGVAILLVTTEPEAILSLADRAVVMRRGRITATFEGDALTKDNLMKSA